MVPRLGRIYFGGHWQSDIVIINAYDPQPFISLPCWYENKRVRVRVGLELELGLGLGSAEVEVLPQIWQDISYVQQFDKFRIKW